MFISNTFISSGGWPIHTESPVLRDGTRHDDVCKLLFFFNVGNIQIFLSELQNYIIAINQLDAV